MGCKFSIGREIVMGKELRNGKQLSRVKVKQQKSYEANVEKHELQNVNLHYVT
jgi:hypothetical protein